MNSWFMVVVWKLFPVFYQLNHIKKRKPILPYGSDTSFTIFNRNLHLLYKSKSLLPVRSISNLGNNISRSSCVYSGNIGMPASLSEGMNRLTKT